MFQKAKQNRVFQDVVEQIQDAILEGRVAPGEKLPAERELKEMFNTSRGTLREALRVLEQKGLIEIRLGAGGGAVVRNVSSDSITENLALLIRSREIDLEDLREFRMGVEGNIAALAAEKAEDRDIERLRGLLATAKLKLDNKEGWQEFTRADTNVHMALARICGNTVYEFIQRSIHDNIHRYYAKYLAREARELLAHYEDLCEIVDAVERRDGEDAGRLMKKHLGRLGHTTEEISEP